MNFFGTDCEMSVTDLTSDNALRTIQNFDFTEKSDGNVNRNLEVIDLTDDSSEEFKHNLSVIDLTFDDDNVRNCEIPVIDPRNNDAEYLACQLQCIDLTSDKHKNINKCNPTIDLTNNQGIDQSSGVINMVSDDGGLDDSLLGCDPTSESIEESLACNDNSEKVGNDDSRKSFEYVESYSDENMNCSKLPSCLQESIAQTHNKIDDLCDDSNENNSMTQKGSLHVNFESADIIRNTEHCYHRKGKTHLERRLSAKIFDENDFKHGKSAETCRHIQKLNLSSNVLKTAHHPIPMRHILQRSVSTTSKNVPIESSENFQDESSALTVSSILCRKKSKTSCYFSKRSLLNSSGLSSSKINALSLDGFVELFIKFWILIFYLILKLVKRIVHLK